MSNELRITSRYLGIETTETPDRIALTLVAEWGEIPTAEDVYQAVRGRHLLWSEEDVLAIVDAFTRLYPHVVG